jgi:hypothetical protein
MIIYFFYYSRKYLFPILLSFPILPILLILFFYPAYPAAQRSCLSCFFLSPAYVVLSFILPILFRTSLRIVDLS